MLITNVNQPVRLLENVSDPMGHWLEVAVVQSRGSNRNGIGVAVYATIGAVTKRRDILAGKSYLAGTPLEVHFGLGDATVIDELRIAWTDGTESVFTDVPADQFVTYTQPLVGDVDNDGDVDFQDLLLLLAAWGDCPEPPEECPADFDGNGVVNFTDILLLLGHWG